MASSDGQLLFEDEFEIKETAKSFERVMRITCHSDNKEMDLILDINSDLYPLSTSDNFSLVLASTLASTSGDVLMDGSAPISDREIWRTGGGLAEHYDYVMYGKVYKFDEGLEERVTAYASFGGLLMALTGSYRHLSNITFRQMNSEKFRKATKTFLDVANTDPNVVNGQPYSYIYHTHLVKWVQALAPNASEALVLSAHCQHIQRWTRPRSDYPEGLSGYKTWRTNLNRFHADTARRILKEAGYEDEELFIRVDQLLMKKTLRGGGDKSSDLEMQIFEDAICLTFLELEFEDFSTKHDRSKMVDIVQKTWKKIGQQGKDVAASQLAPTLSSDAQEILKIALS